MPFTQLPISKIYITIAQLSNQKVKASITLLNYLQFKCFQMQDYSNFISFSLLVFFLFQDPILSRNLHCIKLLFLFSILQSVTAPQSPLVFHELNTFAGYWSVIL